ncbi:MAG: amidohydrolase family protein, partial [Anaerolineaceae bacterium]
GSSTQVIDLDGNTLMPGFFDGHTHILAYPYRMDRTMDEAQEIAIHYGVTSVNEMSADQAMLDTLFQKEKDGSLRLRVNAFAPYNEGYLAEDRKSDIVATWFPENGPILATDRKVRIPGIKIFVDGAMTPNRGCWALSEPLSPEAVAQFGCASELGDFYWSSQDAINQVVRSAQEAGFRVAFHSMGDGAIEMSLNAIEYALAGQSNDLYRHAIQHNSLIRTDQINRMAEMGVVASVRGYADLCDPGNGAIFGPERQLWYVNRYAIPGAGVHAFIESDFGWTSDPSDRFDPRNGDPLVQLYGIVTHQFVNNGVVCSPNPIWHPEQISVEKALLMLTMEPAYAVSMESVVGSIEAGKYADLIILSANPLAVDPDQLKDLQVWMTMIAGKVEFCAAGHEGFCPSGTGEQTTPQAPTVASPEGTISTSIPAGPVQTQQVKYDCDSKSGSPTHIGPQDFLLTTINWASVTREQVEDFQAALQYTVWVNGGQISSSVDYGEITKTKDGKYFFVPVMFDVGLLPPGENKIRTLLGFDRKISDGIGEYGPGTAEVAFDGTCTVIVD